VFVRCLSACPSVCLSVCRPACFFVCLSICQPVCLSVCSFVCYLYVSKYMRLSLSYNNYINKHLKEIFYNRSLASFVADNRIIYKLYYILLIINNTKTGFYTFMITHTHTERERERYTFIHIHTFIIHTNMSTGV